jgi:hypothetical protein
VYTVEINEVPCLAENHKVIVKDAADLTPSDVDNTGLDFIFVDCHEMEVQI